MSANFLKQQLRQKIRCERKQLSKYQQKTLSEKIACNVKQQSLFKKSEKIAFYLCHQKEVDPHLLQQEALKLGKGIYLPALHPHLKNTLVFAKITSQTIFTKNKYGILEPDINTCHTILPWQLDLILVPLVAFDRQCNRLGMGGGYYDRALAFKQKCQSTTMTMGLAYNFQQKNYIPHSAQDIRLDAIATEKFFYTK